MACRIGHHRSSLTEAVTALEVAIHQFAGNPKTNYFMSSQMAQRIGISTLKEQVEHFGLTGTINYILPFIFSEKKLPSDLIRACQEAIQQRQNVVHNGQRIVQPDKLITYLHCIRSVCKILETAQEDDST